jgi:tRNA modification GTPase
MIDDTIAAISTPLGWGGIGIIRISGENAFVILEQIFSPIKPSRIEDIKTQTIKYGHIVNPLSKEVIDEVLVSYFKKPNTYTRESLVEINCHGGALIVRKILELVLKNGARIAEPGEFTKRAFLNGRMDLSQAEAVIEMINSKTNAARKASLNQLEGKLSSKIKSIRNILVESIADIEAAIDYPEYDIEEISREKLTERVKDVLDQIEKLIKTFFEGKIIQQGIVAAIIGKPNVGKSSLLNALAQKEKAIITEVPGTTRDLIEEYIEIAGIAVKIIDTAGLRETRDKVEKIGIDRARGVIDRADLILLVLDGSENIDEEDNKIFELIENKKTVILINKSDLKMKLDLKEIKKSFDEKMIIEISAKEENGLEKIENIISDMFLKRELDTENELIVTNVRHKQIIQEAKEELQAVMEAIEMNTPLDVISVAIIEGANKLGEITGETVQEEVLHTIFSKFCIGK